MSPLLGSLADTGARGFGMFLPSGSAAGSFTSIATVTGNGSATSLTFSSIPTGYTDLQIRGLLVGSSTTPAVRYWFNGDNAGTTYTRHYLYGDGSSAGAGGTANMALNQVFAGTGTVNTYPNVFIIDIADYLNTSKYKTVKSIAGADDNTAGTGHGGINLESHVWMNTAAITSITIDLSTGVAIPSNSTFALYGVKAAV